MRRLRSLWLGLAAAAALAAGAALPQDRAHRLDAEALRRLAYQVMAAGQPAAALPYLDALLARDAADAQALIVRSQALRAMGRTDEARAAARAAWRAAETDQARFGAAMVTAQALSTAGRRTEAQLWLRRAAEVAPTETAEALARRDWRYVRSRNPWTLRFNLSVAPSSNVNGGSDRAKMDFYGIEVDLSGDAMALSGGEVTLGFGATYARPRADGRGRTDFTFAVQAREVWLSDAARAQAPDARGGDYDFAQVEAGVRHGWAATGQPLRFALGAVAGHNWHGGSDLSDYLRVTAEAERALGKRAAVHGSVAAERQWRRDNPDRSAEVLTLGLGGVRMLDNRDRLSLSLTARRTLSDSDEIASEGVTARLGWDRHAPVGGVTVGAGLSLGQRDYARSGYAAGGRQDTSVAVDLSLGFDRFDYMGFSPVLDVRASRNRSNVGLYDSRDVGVSLGLKSTF